MIKIINLQDSRWNEIINSFSNKDIYFTTEFFRASTLIDEGEPILFYFENEAGKVAYTFLKRKIMTNISNQVMFDIVTPYGYGGPLYEIVDDFSYFSISFDKAFQQYCENENIISEFIRFHPVVKGQELLRNTLKPEHIRHTICLDLETDKEEFIGIIPSKTRNMIRKAMKHDIVISELNYKDDLEEFLAIYNETMSRNAATTYYYFSKEYFEQLFHLLGDSLKMFGAFFEGKLISITLIMCYGDFIHYHLSGARQEYMYTGVNNLLLFEIAKWGHENGYKYFHLGGGYKGDGDSLFKFKKSFTKDGVYPFFIGKVIHNSTVYHQLVDEKGIMIDTGFFPLYRS